MNNSLIGTVMQATGLSLQQVRRLVWLWQGACQPQCERIADDCINRMFHGDVVSDHDVLIVHAALISVLPSIHDDAALQRAGFNHDKALQLVTASYWMTRTSPFRYIRTWSGLSTAALADSLGLDRRYLRRLCEVDWSVVKQATYIETLGHLGRWYAANAVSADVLVSALEQRNTSCEIAAPL